MNRIRYLEGMKYVLSDDHMVKTPIEGADIIDPWFRLFPDGRLHILAGFAWDGPSGPTFDTRDSLRASLVHDVFCILIRDRRLAFDWQDTVNEFFREMFLEDALMSADRDFAELTGWRKKLYRPIYEIRKATATARARIWHAGVEIGDAGNPDQGPDRTVKEAP
jgi:hypothetical protein